MIFTRSGSRSTCYFKRSIYVIHPEAPGPTFLTSQKQWVRILQVFSCSLALAHSFPSLDCFHRPSGNIGHGRDPTCLVALLGLQRDEILVFNALSNDAFNLNVLVMGLWACHIVYESAALSFSWHCPSVRQFSLDSNYVLQ